MRMSQQLTSSCIVIFIKATLFDELKETVNNLQELTDQNVTEILLHDSPNLKGNQNWQILKCIIKYILDSKRFLCFSVELLLVFFNYKYDF